MSAGTAPTGPAFTFATDAARARRDARARIDDLAGEIELAVEEGYPEDVIELLEAARDRAIDEYARLS